MRTIALPALALALAAGLLACSGTLVGMKTQNPVPGIREGEWSAIRNKATRRYKLYDRFEHRATITATYLGAPEREAKVNQLAQWLGWTDEEKARNLQAELDEAAKYDDFLVALYTANTRDNDLDAKNSVWRLALKLEPGDVVSHDAKALKADATLAGLFPYLSPFDIVYRVRFPKVAGAPPLSSRPFTLEVSSALGKMPMVFGDGALGPDRPPGTPLAD